MEEGSVYFSDEEFVSLLRASNSPDKFEALLFTVPARQWLKIEFVASECEGWGWDPLVWVAVVMGAVMGLGPKKEKKKQIE